MSAMNIYSDFYVYAYLREDGTPYYIGKGRNYRAWNKSKKHNISVPKNKKRIVFLEKNLTEMGAIALERRYIFWYGRKDIGQGILHNKTNGGDGVSGIKFSEEHKNKIRIAHIGKKHSQESKNKMSVSKSGKKKKPLSKEHKEKLSKVMKSKFICQLVEGTSP